MAEKDGKDQCPVGLRVGCTWARRCQIDDGYDRSRSEIWVHKVLKNQSELLKTGG